MRTLRYTGTYDGIVRSVYLKSRKHSTESRERSVSKFVNPPIHEQGSGERDGGCEHAIDASQDTSEARNDPRRLTGRS